MSYELIHPDLFASLTPVFYPVRVAVYARQVERNAFNEPVSVPPDSELGGTAFNGSVKLSWTPGATRNDFTGAVGFSSAFVRKTVINRVGVYKAHANNSFLPVYIIDANNETLWTANVDLSAASIGDFVYADVTPELELAAGALFIVSATVISGGFRWTDNSFIEVDETVVGKFQAVYADSVSGPYSAWGVPGQTYVGFDLDVTCGFDPIEGMEAVPCYLAEAPMNRDNREEPGTQNFVEHTHVAMLAGYYSAAEANQRAVINSTVYEVVGATQSGVSTHTELKLRKIR